MTVTYETIQTILYKLSVIERQNMDILRQLFNKVNVARIETDEPNPKVLQITKISETSEGLYIRVR